MNLWKRVQKWNVFTTLSRCKLEMLIWIRITSNVADFIETGLLKYRSIFIQYITKWRLIVKTSVPWRFSVFFFFSSLGKYLKSVIEFKDELCVSVLPRRYIFLKSPLKQSLWWYIHSGYERSIYFKNIMLQEYICKYNVW